MMTDAHIGLGVEGNHLIGVGNPPTIVLGPSAGAGSAIVTGTDNGFMVTLTAGAGTAVNNIIFTAIFDTAFSSTPFTVFSPGNKNASANTSRTWVVNVSENSLEFRISNPALVSGTVYVWRFITLG
jgi:hypothetical protein